jgi:collagenase-like PrtC family protease
MIKQMQGERTPAWAEALIAAGKPVRGGLGTLLGQMGNAAQATREGYQAQDLKFFDELSKLNAEIDKAKIEGRYKDVAAGQAAVKELISEKRQAEQSGTSLLNTKENARSREQTANIAAQARRDAAAMQAENAKAKRLQDQNQFLANLEVKHATLLNNDKDYQSMIKQKQFIELQINVTQDEAKRAKLADQLQAQQAKMASYAANKIGGGTVNIPPPPPGAVRETVKKS